MARPIRSFSARLAEKEQQDALETVTLSNRLLAHVLIELMDTRGHRPMEAIATRLQQIGFSAKQAAALLDTTPAALAVGRQRARKSAAPTAEQE